MSGGQPLGGTPRPPRQQRVQNRAASTTACQAPPGFEMLFNSERSKVSTLFEAFVLPLHWSLIRGGLRLRTNESNLASSSVPVTELSEMLPVNWTSQITSKQEEGTNQQMNVLVLRYWHHSNGGVHFEAKVVEVVKNHAIVVLLFRAVNGYGIDGNVQPANKINMDSSSPSRNSAGSNFMVSEYILPSGSVAPLAFQTKNWFEVYRNLQAFEKIVWEQLMDPIGINVSGRPKESGPYDAKSSSTNQSQSQQSQQQQQQQQQNPNDIMWTPSPQPLGPFPTGGIGGPLAVPPALPVGGGGLGRSDLDPLGGFGGGMVADPRGFRQPQTSPFGGTGTGGLIPPPPGARVDPFGPPSPTPNPIRQPPPGPNPGTNWGVPNPDAEQPPPGSEDMFM